MFELLYFLFVIVHQHVIAIKDVLCKGAESKVGQHVKGSNSSTEARRKHQPRHWRSFRSLAPTNIDSHQHSIISKEAIPRYYTIILLSLLT